MGAAVFLYLGAYAIAWLLLVTMGVGYSWMRLPLAVFLWGFLSVQVIILLTRSSWDVDARLVLAIAFMAGNAMGAVTVHSAALRAAAARSQSLRQRRFPTGSGWALTTGGIALFATAATAAMCARVLWTLVDGVGTAPRTAVIGASAVGGILAAVSFGVLRRSRVPIRVLLAADLMAITSHMALVQRDLGTAFAFGAMLAVACIAGIVASTRQSFVHYCDHLANARGSPTKPSLHRNDRI
ncbi:MAG: hypothetical protein ABJA82_10680 [Myxococcales bacterium]